MSNWSLKESIRKQLANDISILWTKTILQIKSVFSSNTLVIAFQNYEGTRKLKGLRHTDSSDPLAELSVQLLVTLHYNVLFQW